MKHFNFISISLLLFVSTFSTVKCSRYINRNWQYMLYTTTQPPTTTPNTSRTSETEEVDTTDPGIATVNSQDRQYLIVDPLTNKILTRISQTELINILYGNYRPQPMKMPDKPTKSTPTSKNGLTEDNNESIEFNSRNQGSRYLKGSNGNSGFPPTNNIFITFNGIGFGIPQMETYSGSPDYQQHLARVCTSTPWVSKQCKNFENKETSIRTENSSNLPSTYRIPLLNSNPNVENPSAKTSAKAPGKNPTGEAPPTSLATGDVEWVKFPDVDVEPSVSQRRSRPKKLDVDVDIRRK